MALGVLGDAACLEIECIKKTRNPTKVQIKAENVQLRQQVQLLTKQVFHMQSKMKKLDKSQSMLEVVGD